MENIWSGKCEEVPKDGSREKTELLKDKVYG